MGNADLYRKLISVIILTVFLCPILSYAQPRTEAVADQWYNSSAYNKAAEIYEKLSEENPQNSKYVQRLAYCYREMQNHEKASLYYSHLVHLDNCSAEDIFQYAQLLKITEKIGEAQIWLQKYTSLSPNDKRAKTQLENINELLEIKSNAENITAKNLDINSKFSDMCPAFYKDRIVYSSAKDGYSLVKSNYEQNNQPFLDLYVSEPISAGSTLKKVTPFSTKLNSRLNEGPVCFTSDFKTIFFTRNSILDGKVTNSPEGINNLKIFIADYSKKEWQNIRMFPYNSVTFSIGHPALSPDNKTLYFVSDMPGGFGGTDIYKSVLINGGWSKPVNLGESINTVGKEMFPFVDKDGVLYFSSDGHGGLGGLDIYAAKQEGDSYVILNLGTPINSDHDDFGYIVNKGTMTGYFTSNRPGGKGDDDIYSFVVSKVRLKVICFKEGSDNVVPETKVSLVREDGSVQSSAIADKNGIVDFFVNPQRNYKLVGEFQDLRSEAKNIRILKNYLSYQQTEDIYLSKSLPFLKVNVVDKETGLPISNVVINIIKGDYDKSTKTSTNGVLRFQMNESTRYGFVASADGYLGNKANYSSTDKSSEENSLTIKLEKIIVGKQFVLEDLYYDVNKSDIRSDAALVLDKLVKFMIENPQIKIELGSHTDSRASTKYNNELSQKRAEAAVNYLIHCGIDPSRMTAKGYGETQLVNKCADGVPCTEAEHQANRRTEFKITDINRSIPSQQISEPVITEVTASKSVQETTKPTEKLSTIKKAEPTQKTSPIVEEKKPMIVEPSKVQTTVDQTPSDDRVYFCVQLLAATGPIKVSAENFNGEKSVQEKKIGKYYKYFSGDFNKFEQALEERKRLLTKFPEAFIVAFKGENPIPVEQARKNKQ